MADKRRASTSNGRWDPRTAAAIGGHLLNGLSGMHGLGFIHRDVKPANFAMTPRTAAVHEGGSRACRLCSCWIQVLPPSHLCFRVQLKLPPKPLASAKNQETESLDVCRLSQLTHCDVRVPQAAGA